MPFLRKDLDDLTRQLELYCRELGTSSATVDVILTDGSSYCALKTLDVTESTVTFLVCDEQAGIDPLEGREQHGHRTAVLVPHDAIRAIVFGPSRSKDKDLRAGFGPYQPKR